jgi:hypothetical protein
MRVTNTFFAEICTVCLVAFCATACADGGEGQTGGLGEGGQAASGNEDAGPELPALVMHPGMFVEEDMPLIPKHDGDDIEIQLALQGGQVIYVAGQLENLQGDIARIESKLIDPETMEVRVEDRRSIVMKPVPGEANLWQPDIRSRSQVSHLVVCPNDEPRSIVGEPWIIEITMSDLDGPRSVTESLTITPVCRQPSGDPQELCTCQCEADYEPGKCN